MLSLFSGGSCWAGRSSAAQTIPAPSSWPTRSSPPCSAVLLAWRDGQSILRSTGRGLDQILRRKADHLAELGVTQGLGRDELQPARVMGQGHGPHPAQQSWHHVAEWLVTCWGGEGVTRRSALLDINSLLLKHFSEASLQDFQTWTQHRAFTNGARGD